MASDQINEIKSKFGTLLYQLIASGFSYEYIEHQIVHNPYFLFFERNDIDSFLSAPIENIVFGVFHKQIYIDYSRPLASEIFWAGQMYISLLLNYSVPLQRSILIYPLEKMISLFNPYHEMGNDKLCKRYLEDEKRTSVLKRLLQLEDITTVRLSLLTGINKNTVIRYTNNDALLSMSIQNASSLASFFEVPECVFAKESSFVPDFNVLFEDSAFQSTFRDVLRECFNTKNEDIVFVDDTSDRKKTLTLLQNHATVFDYRHFVLAKKRGTTLDNLALTKREIRSLGKIAIRRFKQTLPEGTVLF